MGNAKKYFSLNVTTNLLVVLLGGIIGVFMTPFFISRLGVDNYSVIPLLTSFIAYIGFFTSIITTSVGRFCSISFNTGDEKSLNNYLSTAVFSLLFIAILFSIFSSVLMHNLSVFIDIPNDILSETKMLFLLNVCSFGCVAISVPFYVSSFLTHNFYIQNTFKLLTRLLQPLLVLSFFFLLSPSVLYVGFSNLLVNFLYMLSSIVIFKRLLPNAAISARSFDWQCFKKMSTMGSWSLLNGLGALLYTNIDLILISYFLGATACGKYAPLVQILMLFTLITDSLSSVLTPVIYEYIAAREYKLAMTQTCRAIRYIGSFMVLPVSILAVYSSEILVFWLGEEYSEMAPVLILLLMPAITSHPVRPVMAISRAVNKVKYPAIASLFGGFLNLFLSILFLKYTTIGVFGVGIATIFCLVLKNLIFTCSYSSIIINMPINSFFKPVLLNIFLFVVTSATYYLAKYLLLGNILALGLVSLFIIPSLFFVVVYRYIFNEIDRSFFRNIVFRQN